MARLRPVPVDKQSPFIGESCALCKQPFAPGDELAICPEDATRHHVHCWRAYGNKCTAYGCTGHGEVVEGDEPDEEEEDGRVEATSDSHVETLPARSFHCAQSCLVLAIAISIILFSIGCFGLWAIADYLMMEVFHLPYRAPLTQMISPGFFTSLSLLLRFL
ncbi:MAG: RING finger protein [Candidatus Promineifilaceae bacterium]